MSDLIRSWTITGDGDPYEILDERNCTIADVFGKSNARLVIASPDLLAFAKAYREDLNDRGVHESDMDEIAMDLLIMADAAIKKAEG